MSDNPNYQILLRRCRLGDERAWKAIVDEFQRLVYSIPKRSGLPDSDCDDVFQTTFLALYRNLDRIEDPQTLPRWLAVTATRETYRVMRLNSTRASAETLEDTLAAEDAEVEKDALAAVESERLHLALNRLGGRCEPLLRMLYFDESPYELIASRLKMAVGAIGPTRARCLEKLRRMFSSDPA